MMTKKEVNAKWQRERGAAWREANRSTLRQRWRDLRLKHRDAAFRKLGDRCSNPACQWLNPDGSRGCVDRRCLQFDHIVGGGNTERKQGKGTWFVVQDVLRTIGKYQLLCANCNWIKRCMNNEIFHLRG